MNIKQIAYFVSVFNHGSLSAAAKEQYVTVQAVSKAVGDLERELGSDLFVRESRGVRPTAFGKSFYVRAVPVLQGFEGLEQFAQSEVSPGDAPLRLASCIPKFPGSKVVGKSIAYFMQKVLGVTAAVEVGSWTHELEKLRAGEIDAMITIGALAEDDVDCIPFGSVPPGAVMRKGHPLAQKKTVRVCDLAPFTPTTSGDFETFNRPLREAFAERGVTVGYEPMDRHGFARFLEADGVSFAASIPALGAMFPNAVLRPIDASEDIAIPICLVSLKGEKPASYFTLERWLMDELNVLGSESFRRIVSMVVDAHREAKARQ